MDKKNTIYFQTKSFSEIKEADDWEVIIEGFASTKDIDRYRDIVEPKAFKNAIELFMKNPIMLLQHNQNKPIGTFTEAKVTPKGLKVKWLITNDIENVKDNVKKWVLKGFSIWFIVKAWKFETIDWVEVRVITDLELLEISVVAVPANPFTLFQAVKKYFNSLENEQMEKENQTNEIKEEILDEKQLEVKEEEVEENETTEEKETEEENGADELHNEVISEDSENSDETAEDSKETEVEETTEEAEWNTEAETEEETTEDDKGWETDEESQEDLKSLVPELLDILEKQNEKIKELETTINSIWIKKGLKTLKGNTTDKKETSNTAWVKAFKNAKNNINY